MPAFAAARRVIFDLGMNNGDDTAYYLECGFAVVGVEANPRLCDLVAQRFAVEIVAGRLAIINAAIGEPSTKETEFHVNLDNDHWSSIYPGYATRDGSRCEIMTVRCVTLSELVSAYGLPHYLKIDVEGADGLVLDQIGALELKPHYVSVEDCRFGLDYIKTLANCGYDGFKLVEQSILPPGTSGPFGEYLPGPWCSRDEIEQVYSDTVRDRQGRRLKTQGQWHDIHCQAGRAALARKVQDGAMADPSSRDIPS